MAFKKNLTFAISIMFILIHATILQSSGNCASGQYNDYNRGKCSPCHKNCQTCSGSEKYNCITCAQGMLEDKATSLMSPKHCVDSCPFGTYQSSDDTCLQKQNTMYFLIAVAVFLIGLPLAISLCWRSVKRSQTKKLSQKMHGFKIKTPHAHERLDNEDDEDLVQISSFYYHNIQLKKGKCGQFCLCMLACSDLTFTGLNSDLSFLRETVALLNMARSGIYLISNILIFKYLSSQFSGINIITILILIPLPFVYKCITPKNRPKKKLISHQSTNLIQLDFERNLYTQLDLQRSGINTFWASLFSILSIVLFLFVFIFELPNLKWLVFIILIHYGGHLIWSIFWGLICYLTKDKNQQHSISKIPDWRVEMVFQDILLMNGSLGENPQLKKNTSADERREERRESAKNVTSKTLGDDHIISSRNNENHLKNDSEKNQFGLE